MCLGNGYKLRVSSMYPTNSGKQAYFVYDNTDGAESITFYKVPDRATVNERNNGLVESANEMLEHTIRINQDYGFTKDSPLVDVINLFNGYTYNNVLRFSIIDKDGTDITASPDAYSIPVGALFPGIYFIGRSKKMRPRCQLKQMFKRILYSTTVMRQDYRMKRLTVLIL